MRSRTTRRAPPPSRLRIAWTVLILGVAGLMIAAILAPVPEAEPVEVALTLPAAPDPYAPGPDRSGSEPVLMAAPEESEEPPQTPEEALAAAGEDAVIITVPEAAASRPRAAQPAVLPSRPDPALTVSAADGPRPGRGVDGSTPFAAYRRAQAAGEARGLALVLSGLGLDPALTERAIDELPPEISLAFAPYARDLPDLIARANAAGHEVLIEVPMGTPGVAPGALGPAGLLADRRPSGNMRRLDWILSRAPAYPMLTNYLGEGFSRDSQAIGLVMQRLSEVGLGYIDDTGQAEAAARAAGVPYAATDRLITPDSGDLAQTLRALARSARSDRVALGKVYVTEDAVDILKEWAEGLPQQGVALVPASTAAAGS